MCSKPLSKNNHKAQLFRLVCLLFLIMTDEGLCPQQRKSGVALFRRNVVTTGKTERRHCYGNDSFYIMAYSLCLVRDLAKVRNVVEFRHTTNTRAQFHDQLMDKHNLDEIHHSVQ